MISRDRQSYLIIFYNSQHNTRAGCRVQRNTVAGCKRRNGLARLVLSKMGTNKCE